MPSAWPVSGSWQQLKGPGQEKKRKRPVGRKRGDKKNDKPVALGGRAWLSQLVTGQGAGLEKEPPPSFPGPRPYF